MVRTLAAAVLISLVASGAGAQEPVRAGDLVLERPWARASIGTSRPGAAYVTIRNEGAERESLTGVSTEIAATAEVHETVTEDGVTRMQPAGTVEIDPAESVSLAPGGMHIMLMDLREPLVEGEALTLFLTIEGSGEVAVPVPILGIGSRGPEQ